MVQAMKKEELIHKALTETPETEWERELYGFVNRWTDETDYIEVKTSGSTGLPKLIRHKKATMLESARMTCDFLKLEPGMSALICLGTRNIAGMMMVVRAFGRNLDIIVADPGGHPLRDVPDGPVDFCAMVPAQLYNSLQSPEEKAKLMKINNLIIGGAPVSYSLEQQIRELPGNIYLTFGMTETMSHIALRKLNGPDASDEFTVLEGITIETGAAGNLVINAPYLSDEPIITNDLIKITGYSKFSWLGRMDHVINTGGFKIIAEDTETRIAGVMGGILSATSSTQRYFITGVPDEKLGEVPVLVIEMEEQKVQPHLTKRILDSLAGILPRHEVPRRVLYTGRFIETPTQKIIRSATLKKISNFD